MSADDTRARAIEAGARAIFENDPECMDSLRERAIAATVVDAVEPIIRADERAMLDEWWRGAAAQCRRETEAEVRERIAQEIEALPIDAYGSQEPRGPVSFARAEAFIRAARIARGGAQ